MWALGVKEWRLGRVGIPNREASVAVGLFTCLDCVVSGLWPNLCHLLICCRLSRHVYLIRCWK